MSVNKRKVGPLLAARDGGWRCRYCSEDLNYTWQPDHVIPRSTGGPDAIWNLVLSCKPCNDRKRVQHPRDFIFSLYPDDSEYAEDIWQDLYDEMWIGSGGAVPADTNLLPERIELLRKAMAGTLTEAITPWAYPNFKNWRRR
jgi:hypothetical protein